MDHTLRLKRFRVRRRVTPETTEQLLRDFFADVTVHGSLELPPEVNLSTAKSLSLTKLKCDVVSLSFFDKLIDAKIVSSSGSLRRCMDEIFEGATASDLLKEMMINPDSDNAHIFTEEEQSQFIFELLRAFVIGGSMCQPDETFLPYEDIVRQFYKSMISVKKNPNDRDAVMITSQVFKVQDPSLFPHDSPYNTCFTIVDPKKRLLTVWYNHFRPFW